jgi:hypothetical protein
MYDNELPLQHLVRNPHYIRRGRVVSTPASYVGGLGFKYQTGKRLS